jgi:hypothetical protein
MEILQADDDDESFMLFFIILPTILARRMASQYRKIFQRSYHGTSLTRKYLIAQYQHFLHSSYKNT